MHAFLNVLQLIFSALKQFDLGELCVVVIYNPVWLLISKTDFQNTLGKLFSKTSTHLSVFSLTPPKVLIFCTWYLVFSINDFR